MERKHGLKEIVEFLSNKYLVVGSPLNPPNEECERHNEFISDAICAIEALDRYEALKSYGGEEMSEKDKEYCKWQSPTSFMDNVEFEIQCEHNPLRGHPIPNNFAYQNFKFCPFCGREIKWISWRGFGCK